MSIEGWMRRTWFGAHWPRMPGRRDADGRLTMISGEDLENSGICILNGDAAGLPEKTIIVLGLERGGTSMVAGALHRLGVYMGETLSSAVHEDHQLGRLLRADTPRQAQALIADRNARYPIWGLKRPTLRLIERRWHTLFRNPVYVVVFRDILAVSSRRSLSRGRGVLPGMRDSLDAYLRLQGFISRTERPAMLLSYEKALHNPALFVRSLAGFLGIADAGREAEAAAFIRPSPDAYLRASRVHDEWLGCIEQVRPRRIEGWALRVGEAEPVEVVLTLPDGTELVAPADRSRMDVREYHRHPSERIGFFFQLPKERRLRRGDTIHLRIRGEVHELNNSPFEFRPSPGG